MPSPLFDNLGTQILSAFKDADKATFTPADGDEVEVDVIFNRAHRQIDADGKPYGEARPVAWVLKATGVSPKFGDEIHISGTDYIIKEAKADGHELIELALVTY